MKWRSPFSSICNWQVYVHVCTCVCAPCVCTGWCVSVGVEREMGKGRKGGKGGRGVGRLCNCVCLFIDR